MTVHHELPTTTDFATLAGEHHPAITIYAATSPVVSERERAEVAVKSAFDEAIARTLKLAPNKPEALSAKASRLNDLGQSGQAVAFGRKALALDPLNRSTIMTYGKALMNVGQLDESERQFHSATELYPEYEQAKYQLAMVLAGQPRLLLLDEPMAGMSQSESQRMTTLLQSLRGQYTMVLVEHDMDAVFALADRITVLVYGRSIACDHPDAIRNNAQVRAAYLGDDT